MWVLLLVSPSLGPDLISQQLLDGLPRSLAQIFLADGGCILLWGPPDFSWSAIMRFIFVVKVKYSNELWITCWEIWYRHSSLPQDEMESPCWTPNLSSLTFIEKKITSLYCNEAFSTRKRQHLHHINIWQYPKSVTISCLLSWYDTISINCPGLCLSIYQVLCLSADNILWNYNKEFVFSPFKANCTWFTITFQPYLLPNKLCKVIASQSAVSL